MEALKELTQGLEILDPFLKRHGFLFSEYENEQGSSGQLISGTFKNGQKKFVISYIATIGQVGYQFDNSKVHHDFYVDQLGHTNKRKFSDFLSADKLTAYNNILHDFEFLIDDFFQGQCLKLIEFSKLQEEIITQVHKKAHQEFSLKFDTIRIESARQEFSKKEFKKSISIYSKVEDKKLLNDLDKNIIAFCERQMKLK